MSSIIFFFVFIVLLGIILLSLNLLLAPHSPYPEKSSTFECGFSSFLGQNRQEFSISFFIFGILFLIFDLEIVLLYPYVVSAYNNSIYGLVIVIIFLTILTAGFVFEIGKGVLKINSRQSNNLNNIYLAPSASSTKNRFNQKLNLNRRFYSTKSYQPVKCYYNADTQKQEILAENKGKSGIFMWTNLAKPLSY